MSLTNNVNARYVGEAGQRYFQHRSSWERTSAQSYSSRQFRPHVRPGDTVLDFGAGTGGILSNLDCARRIAIEVNEPSAAAARAVGIEVYADICEIADECVNVVITHHALEHTANPFDLLGEFHRVLAPGGKLVIIVPCEPGRRRRFQSWRENLDVHLYSWNPLSLGNLVGACGFNVQEARVSTAGYSRFIKWMLSIPPFFTLAERVVAHTLGRFNTICVGSKPAESA